MEHNFHAMQQYQMENDQFNIRTFHLQTLQLFYVRLLNPHTMQLEFRNVVV